MKINKNVWGVLAFFPWIVIVSAVMIHMTQGLQPVVNLSLFGIIIYAFIALTLFSIGILFIIHAWSNKRIEWVLILLLLSPFVYPIYWWKYVQHPQLQLYESSRFLDTVSDPVTVSGHTHRICASSTTMHRFLTLVALAVGGRPIEIAIAVATATSWTDDASMAAREAPRANAHYCQSRGAPRWSNAVLTG